MFHPLNFSYIFNHFKNYYLILELSINLTTSSINIRSESYNYTLTQNIDQCTLYKNYTISSKFLMNEISFKYEYEIENSIPKAGKHFCQTCVALDPKSKTTLLKTLNVIEECQDIFCKPDLKLFGNSSGQLFVGNSTNVTISYEIINLGETAPLPKIKLIIPDSVKYNKLPPSCSQKKVISECICNVSKNGNFLKHSETFNINFTFIISEVTKKSININAFVYSDGLEQNEADNSALVKINFIEYSEIRVHG